MITTSGEPQIICGQFRIAVNESGAPQRVMLSPLGHEGVDIQRVIQFDTDDGYCNLTARFEMVDGTFFYGHYNIDEAGNRMTTPVGHFAPNIEGIVPPHLREHLK